MAAVVALGTIVLAALSIICVAAYAIKPQVLEASSVVGGGMAYAMSAPTQARQRVGLTQACQSRG
jgi:hypothetical protein